MTAPGIDRIDDTERIDDAVLERYLARVGLDRSDHGLTELHQAHIRSIAYENLDIHLGRRIRLDLPSLVAKMVDKPRGGYCYEQNTLFAAVLEALGFTVTRYLGRVRMAYGDLARPATHMVLVVDGVVLDVGFGGANPLGPIPLGGEATYGPHTWWMERTATPEGEDAWQVRLGDQLVLYSFAEQPKHPVDYVTPNHYSSTHPESTFTQNTIAQCWTPDHVQLGLVGLDLTERLPDGSVQVTTIDRADYGSVLKTRFGLVLDDDELARLEPVRAG